MNHPSLPENYEIRLMSAEDFSPLWNEHARLMFDESQLFYRPYDSFTAEEKEKAESLKLHLKEILRIRLGLFFRNAFVGWSWGYQETAETFYMCNSGILEEHRRKGLYTALLNRIVKEAVAVGFQKIYGRHTATNNAVIIAKLKANFVITNLELSDSYGVLVHLSYFPNQTRKKILDFRAGQSRPDADIKKILKL